MKKFLLGAFLLNAMLILLSGQAFASYATATATLNISGLFNPADYTVTSSGTYAYANAYNSIPENVSQYASNPYIADLNATASVTQASATSRFTDGLLTATSSSGPDGLISPYSGGNVVAWADFEYTGTSNTINISIPYSLIYDISASPGTGSLAYAYTEAYVRLTRNSGGETYTYESTWNLAYPGESFSGTNSGVLELIKTFLAGDIGHIEFGVISDTHATATPIPAVAWLLGSGLIGLVGIRRRLKA